MIPVKIRNQVQMASTLNSKLGAQGYVVYPVNPNQIKVYCQYPELLPKTQNLFLIQEILHGKVLTYTLSAFLDGIEYICLDVAEDIPEGM